CSAWDSSLTTLV
nr:immunoglobulin light chain junction region [Macaca mulatta]